MAETFIVSFQNSEDILDDEETLEEATSYSVLMEFDSEYTEQVNGDTSLEIGDTGYLKLFPPDSIRSYELESNWTLEVESSDVLFDFEETLTFSYDDSQSLNQLPHSITSVEWIGDEGGSYTRTGKLFQFSSPVIGVLKVSYKALGDRLKATGEGETICVAKYPITDPESDEEYDIASTTLTFSDPDEDEIDSGDYSIELDSDYFETVTGVNKTTYNPEETVYLRTFPSKSKEDYSLTSSFGDLTVKSIGIVYTKEKEITFINSFEENLDPDMKSIISHEWIGNSYGTPSFSNGKVSLSKKVTGVLKVIYTILGDRLELNLSSGIEGKEEFSVLCASIYGENKASTTVSFNTALAVDEDGNVVKLTDVGIVVKDAESELPIPYAQIQVYRVGYSFIGTSDSEGKVLLENLMEGKTYNIKTTATNYYSSDEDYLNNDTFTVPISEEEGEDEE